MDETLIIGSSLASELNKRVKIDKHPLWGSQCLLTNKQAEVDTHRDFIRSGVDILQTNTYQASIEGFVKYLGLNETESYHLMKESVARCQEAISIEKQSGTINVEKRILIAGAVGSFGAHLCDGSEYHGDFVNKFEPKIIQDWHRPRIKALIEGGVDMLAFETIPSVEEAILLVELLKEYPHMKAWLSFTGKDEYHTSRGEPFVEAAIKCWSLNLKQIIAIGVNCTAAPIAHKLISQLRANRADIPLIIYPNCGRIWDADNKVWKGNDNSESMEEYTRLWCAMGVKYIGRCCGTPTEIWGKMIAIIAACNKTIKKEGNCFSLCV